MKYVSRESLRKIDKSNLTTQDYAIRKCYFFGEIEYFRFYLLTKKGLIDLENGRMLEYKEVDFQPCVLEEYFGLKELPISADLDKIIALAKLERQRAVQIHKSIHKDAHYLTTEDLLKNA